MHLCCFCGQSCPLFRVSEMEKDFFLKGGLDLPLDHFLVCLYRTLGVCPHCRFRPAWMGHWSYKKDTWAHLAPSQVQTKRGDLKGYPSPWPNPAWTQVGLKTSLEKRAHVLWLQVEQTDDPKEIKADEVLLSVQGNTSSEPWGFNVGETEEGHEPRDEGLGEDPLQRLCVILPVCCDPRSIVNILPDAATWSPLGCRTQMSWGEGQAQPLY